MLHAPVESSTEGSSKGRAAAARRRVLEPIERTSEILFGVIMALTFTGSISAAEARREEVRVLLITAITCNVAWGIVDGVMYLMSCLADRAKAWRTGRAFRAATRPEAAHQTIAGALPAAIADALDADSLEAMRVSLSRALVDPPRPRLRREDFAGALAVFLVVTVTTFPIVIPFLFTSDATLALRVSNAIAIVLLFIVGWAFGKSASVRPWAAGAAMVAIGLVLVAVAMALGG